MAFPFIPFVVAGGIAHAFGSFITRSLGAPLEAKLKPIQYWADSNEWFQGPVLFPTAADGMDLYNRGLIDLDNLKEICAYNGINIGIRETNEWATWRIAAWRQVLESRRQVPDVSVIMDLWKHDRMTDDDLRVNLVRAGADPVLFSKLGAGMLDRPDTASALSSLVRNRLTEDEVAGLCTKAGTRLDYWKPVLPATYTIPSILDMVTATNRGILEEKDFPEWLKFNGVHDDWAADVFNRLRQDVPSISDLLRMGARQVFSPQIVGDYGLYQEYPDRLNKWFANLGLNYELDFQVPTENGNVQATLPILYWAITREILPLGSAYLAYQRLRPDRLDRYKAEIPGIRKFDIADLQYHMRVAGYPPPMRDFLVALSHPPLSRRDIQWAMRFLGKGIDWAREQYMDLGFSKIDAQVLADTQAAREEHRKNAWLELLEIQTYRRTVREIEGLYEDGLITREQAETELGRAGLKESVSGQILDLVEFSAQRSLVRAGIRETGRDFMTGELSDADVLAQLARLGIQAPRALNLLSGWSIRRNRRRKMAATADIKRWVKLGLMDPVIARTRLANLGWTDPDATLQLAEAEGEHAQRQGRLEKALQADQRRKAAELEKVAKEAEQQARQARAELNRIASRQTLTRWMQDAVITEEEFRHAMEDRGYPKYAIDDYVKDSKLSRREKAQQRTARALWPRQEGSAHPSLYTLRRWVKEEVITLDQFDQMLKAIGYGDDDRKRFLADVTSGGNGSTSPTEAPAP